MAGRLITLYLLAWVQLAAQPDDPLYGNRNNFRSAGFEEAWNLNTGGSTVDGREIVIAILDDGFDTDHEDLRDNLWINKEEIAGDGIDNDGNGYVDDVHGWNFKDGNGSYPFTDHGTMVAGIIAATGNNGIGISGGNWRSKLMLFRTQTDSDLIAAYNYISDQRSLYQKTSGRRGALVVVTNLSFGMSGRSCADFPDWGGMYDRLGALGILSCVSVGNFNADIDVRGDMPSDCPSAFLVSVTNVDSDNRLHGSAAFGIKSVDIGAPGEGSLTTRSGNQYGGFGGTSAAAAYVTSAIALLYATPCNSLSRSIINLPSALALEIKSALLTTVTTTATLTGKTVSGGTLNVAAAQQRLLHDCTIGE